MLSFIYQPQLEPAGERPCPQILTRFESPKKGRKKRQKNHLLKSGRADRRGVRKPKGFLLFCVKDQRLYLWPHSRECMGSVSSPSGLSRLRTAKSKYMKPRNFREGFITKLPGASDWLLDSLVMLLTRDFTSSPTKTSLEGDLEPRWLLSSSAPARQLVGPAF